MTGLDITFPILLLQLLQQPFLLLSESQGSKWKVTRVGELGRPLKRLKEQMKKLQLDPSDSVSTKSERKALGLEQQLVKAEEKVRRMEVEKQGAEANAALCLNTSNSWAVLLDKDVS